MEYINEHKEILKSIGIDYKNISVDKFVKRSSPDYLH